MPLKRRTTEQDNLLAAPREVAAAPRRVRRQRAPLIPTRRTLRVLGLGFAALALAVISLPLLVRAGRFRPAMIAELSALTGRHVEMGGLSYSLISGALVASDFTIADDPAFGRAPFLQAKRVYFRTGYRALLFGREPEVTSVTFQSPTILLKEDGSARWNFYSLLEHASKATPDAMPAALRIEGGRIGVESLDTQRSVGLTDAQLDLPAMALRGAAPFSLSATAGGKGRLKVNGTAGPVTWEGRMPVIPVSALISLQNADLARANAPGAPEALGGVISLDGSLESDGRIAHLNGQMRSRKLRLSQYGTAAPDKLDAEFSLHYDLHTHAGALDRCDIAVAKGTASLEGRYSGGHESPLLDLRLSVNGAPATQLAQFLPALGFPLPGRSGMEGGVVVADLTVHGSVEHPEIAGLLEVDGAKLTQFDIASKMSAVEDLNVGDLGTGVEVLSWKSTIQTVARGLELNGLDVAITGLGELTGSGVISPGGTLDFRMNGTRGLTGPKGTPIPFSVQGTTADPVFRELPRTD